MSQMQEAQRAKALNKSVIMKKPNVVGLGVGYKTSKNSRTDELSVVVLVRDKIPLAGLAAEAVVPAEVEGVRTDVLQVGELRPLMSRTTRWRPAPGGVSIGHYKITAGTLGGVVHDRKTGERLILSNNHVLANNNNALPGDPILQPGPADGGQLGQDLFARLERFQPILFNITPPTCNLALSYVRIGNMLARLFGSSHHLQAVRSFPLAMNLVDAAVAKPVDNSVILDEIIDIGAPSGAVKAALGMPVRKSGRTTASTNDEIQVMDATVSINYGLEQSATFEKQLVSGPMSSGGDSGSLVVTGSTPNAVGLLFAGSMHATIFNPIHTVLNLLKVEINAQEASAKAMQQSTIEKAQAVRQRYQDWLMSKPNVVGIGIGLRHAGGKRTDTVAIIVMVSKKKPKHLLAPEDLIPAEIDGVPVDVKEVGEINAL